MQSKVYLTIGDVFVQLEATTENSDNELLLREHFKPIPEESIFIKQWNITIFFQIIDKDLEDFLEYDHCNILADNYLIAMVFTYFVRASLKPFEYTPFNFFVALYLANIMEEDDIINYENIRLWAVAKSKSPNKTSIFKTRDNIFKRMNYRCVVSRNCCEIVMKAVQPDHKVWHRKRHENHSGAISEYYRKKNTCPLCCNITEDKVNNMQTKFSYIEAQGISVHAIKRFKWSH